MSFYHHFKIHPYTVAFFSSYINNDINKRIEKPIKLDRIATAKLHEELNKLARDLNQDINNGKDIDYLCNKLTSNLYQAC